MKWVQCCRIFSRAPFTKYSTPWACPSKTRYTPGDYRTAQLLLHKHSTPWKTRYTPGDYRTAQLLLHKHSTPWKTRHTPGDYRTAQLSSQSLCSTMLIKRTGWLWQILMVIGGEGRGGKGGVRNMVIMMLMPTTGANALCQLHLL